MMVYMKVSDVGCDDLENYTKDTVEADSGFNFYSSVEKYYDVVVVGGGPVGCFAAHGFASQGVSVLVVEEHHEIGFPVHCAGFITPRSLEMVNEGDRARTTILNSLVNAKVHAPDGRIVEIPGKVPRAYLVDRARFDRVVAERAVVAGAGILLNCRATGISINPMLKGKKEAVSVFLQFRGKEVEVKCSLLIGADGVAGRVAKWCGLPGPDVIFPGLILRMAGLHLKPDTVELFVGKDMIPDFFAWVIPQGNQGNALVGLALGSAPPSRAGCMKDDPEQLKEMHFLQIKADGNPSLFHHGLSQLPYGMPSLLFIESLLSNPAFRDIFSGGRVLGYYAGGIPVGFNQRTYSDNVILVGDAACQVKPLSGGGIYTGFLAASCACKVGLTALRKGDLSAEVLADYQRMWEGAFGREIRTGLLLRKAWLNIDDATINSILKDIDDPAVLQMISTYGDIDYPSRVARVLLKRSPRFIKYAPSFLISLLKERGA